MNTPPPLAHRPGAEAPFSPAIMQWLDEGDRLQDTVEETLYQDESRRQDQRRRRVQIAGTLIIATVVIGTARGVIMHAAREETIEPAATRNAMVAARPQRTEETPRTPLGRAEPTQQVDPAPRKQRLEPTKQEDQTPRKRRLKPTLATTARPIALAASGNRHGALHRTDRHRSVAKHKAGIQTPSKHATKKRGDKARNSKKRGAKRRAN